MRVLVTGARAPVALELVRAFSRCGHEVFVADTPRVTLAGASRHVREAYRVPSPRFDRSGFVDALEAILARAAIDVLVPTCEEVFHVARALDRLAARARLYTMPLPVLARLHHKGSFQAWAADLGLRTPRTLLVSSPAALADAIACFDGWLAKPAYSRFAARLVTNRGPLASRGLVAHVRPTPEEPWLVQEFVAGSLLCTTSTLRSGRVTAHCAYRAPFQHRHGSAVQFLSVDGGPTLGIVERIGAALAYTGHLALDFIDGDAGLHVLECNPRATSGLHLMPNDRLSEAILGSVPAPWVVPPGRVRQLWAPLLLSGSGSPGRWREWAGALLRRGDAVLAGGDPLPALAQIPLGLHFAALARRTGVSMTAATTHDIEWNGEA